MVERKKTNYLFNLSSSNVIEAKGWDVHQAKREAENKIRETYERQQSEGLNMWKEVPKIIGYDTFNRDGISFRNWKKIPNEHQKFINAVNLGSSSHYGEHTAQVRPR